MTCMAWIGIKAALRGTNLMKCTGDLPQGQQQTQKPFLVQRDLQNIAMMDNRFIFRQKYMQYHNKYIYMMITRDLTYYLNCFTLI